jgi:hypothetical protein
LRAFLASCLIAPGALFHAVRTPSTLMRNDAGCRFLESLCALAGRCAALLSRKFSAVSPQFLASSPVLMVICCY